MIYQYLFVPLPVLLESDNELHCAFLYRICCWGLFYDTVQYNGDTCRWTRTWHKHLWLQVSTTLLWQNDLALACPIPPPKKKCLVMALGKCTSDVTCMNKCSAKKNNIFCPKNKFLAFIDLLLIIFQQSKSMKKFFQDICF